MCEENGFAWLNVKICYVALHNLLWTRLYAQIFRLTNFTNGLTQGLDQSFVCLIYPNLKIFIPFPKYLPLLQNMYLYFRSGSEQPTLVRCLGPGAGNLLCKKLFLLARFLIRKARFSEPVFGILQRASAPAGTIFISPPVVIDEVCGQENRRGLGAHAAVGFQCWYCG